jgi:hypothetical protein
VPTSASYASLTAPTAGCDENGIVLPACECKLVLNVYKTAKTYKQFVERCLQSWRRCCASVSVPRTYLLVGPRDKPLSDDNYGTQVKTTMDKHFISSASTTCATST